MFEYWKPIVGFDKYEVSSLGKIKSFNKYKYGIILPLRCNSNGYPTICLYKSGKGYRKLIHYLVLTAFKGPKPKGLECAHLDNNRKNNNLYNLKWVTRSENQQMRVISNPESYLHPWKLTLDDAEKIRGLYFNENESQTSLAKRFNVSNTTISKVVNNKRRNITEKIWKHKNRDLKIVELRNMGYEYRKIQIKLNLNISRSFLPQIYFSTCKKLKISPMHFPYRAKEHYPERNQQIRELYKQGKTQKSIAKKYGLNPSRISAICKG